MKKYLDYFWPALGLAAVIASDLLYREFRGQERSRGFGHAPGDLGAQLSLAVGGTILAYRRSPGTTASPCSTLA